MKSSDDTSATIVQFRDLCRVCLKEVDLDINIFRCLIENHDVLISDALAVCAPVKVIEDNRLPQRMCSDCLVTLSQMYGFVDKCLQTEEVLKSCLDVIENKEDNSGTEELITIISESENISPNENTTKNEEVVVKIEDAGFNCHLCSESFEKQEELRLHVAYHEEEQKHYQCDKCYKRFNFKHNLIRHQLVHDGVKRYYCEDCGKGFVQLVQLESHIKTHTKRESFICELCGSVYKHKHFLLRHIESIHKIPVPKEIKEEPDYEVETDSTNTQKRTGFLCDDCGKSLRTRMALKLHMRIHTGEKPHICSDCGRAFAQGSSLIYHKRTHTGEKPYMCYICERTFVQPAHLKTHMKTHTGEKPYVCPFCGKDFALKKNMIVHSRIHTGERPYACSLCDKKFIDPSSRKKHFRGHKLESINTSDSMSMDTIETPVLVISSEM